MLKGAIMKRFKCEVTRVDEYIIEIDENVINQEYMDDWKKQFYKFDTLKEHAEHIAQLRARFPDDSFIEGYGKIKVNGKPPFSFNDKEIREDFEDAINIQIVSEDRNCNVDVEEI
jgi:hypothetical protein